MKKRIIAILLSLCLVISMMPATALAGTESISGNWFEEVTAVPDGYQVEGTTITIASAEGMAWFAKQIKAGDTYAGKRIMLANDIDLGAHYWLNWGLATNTLYFAGEFDGDGHTISNLYAIATTGQGLFPEIKGGVVKNLKIQNVDFSATSNVVDACGVISPKLTKGTITNCHVSNGKITIRSGAGGIVGATEANKGGIISYCSVSDFTFTLTASDHIRGGGIAGELRPGNVYTNCFVKNVDFNLTHTASSKELNVGGIAGFNLGGSIDHCCVRGFSATFNATDPVIKIGTVVGSFNSGSVIQCYATENETYSHTGSGTTADVTILSDSQFNDATNFSELDFGKVWCIEEGNGLALQAASQFPAVFYAEKLNIQNDTTSGVIGSYNGSGAAISQQLAVSIPIGCNSVTISASPSSGATISGLPTTVEFGEDASVTAVKTCEFTVSYSGEPDKTYRITMTRPKVLSGEGTENSPILVSSLEDLTFLSDNLSQRAISDAYVSLTADIDCQGKTIKPVESVKAVAGNQHTISNFTVSDPYTKNTGLFKTLNANGLISDLYLENAHFSGGANSGLLVGTISENASLTKCAVVNSDFLGDINHYNGLLFGTNRGTVSNCYVKGDTRKASNNILTGAIGGTNAGIVKNCYSDVYVTGNNTANNKGPFVFSNTSGQITNCIWNAEKISNCFDIGPASHSIHNGTVINSAGVIVGNGSFAQQQVLDLSEDGLPQPKRDGYVFSGWYVTSISENVETLDRANTYQAKWTPNTYTIKFNGGDGVQGDTASVTATYDEYINLRDNGFTMVGKKFAGWAATENGEVVYANSASVINLTSVAGATVNLYAVWETCDHSSSTAKPTCTDSATCSVCGGTIAALGHSYGDLIQEVPATYTTTGTKAHYECSVCHLNFDESKNELSDLAIPVKDPDPYTITVNNIPANIYAGERATGASAALSSEFGRTYEHVRFVVEVTTPAGATVQILAKDSNGVEWDMAKVGWGPAEGFAIAGPVNNVTAFDILADKTGEYTATFQLIDLDNANAVIASGTQTINVVNRPSIYIPPVQKPVIGSNDNAKTELSSDGTKLTITAEEGYKVVDVLVNGVSKGAVTELTGLKTGDKVEVVTEKVEEPAADPDAEQARIEKIIKGVEATTLKARSTKTEKGIKITWEKSKGYKVDYYEIYRSTKRYSGYGKEPFFTTKSGEATTYTNTKDLTRGTTYYYKVRGVRIIDGQKHYTEYSTKAIRTW